jgi:hypothetical protein
MRLWSHCRSAAPLPASPPSTRVTHTSTHSAPLGTVTKLQPQNNTAQQRTQHGDRVSNMTGENRRGQEKVGRGEERGERREESGERREERNAQVSGVEWTRASPRCDTTHAHKDSAFESSCTAHRTAPWRLRERQRHSQHTGVRVGYRGTPE